MHLRGLGEHFQVTEISTEHGTLGVEDSGLK